VDAGLPYLAGDEAEGFPGGAVQPKPPSGPAMRPSG